MIFFQIKKKKNSINICIIINTKYEILTYNLDYSFTMKNYLNLVAQIVIFFSEGRVLERLEYEPIPCYYFYREQQIQYDHRLQPAMCR